MITRMHSWQGIILKEVGVGRCLGDAWAVMDSFASPIMKDEAKQILDTVTRQKLSAFTLVFMYNNNILVGSNSDKVSAF